jgi:hypothetical protein
MLEDVRRAVLLSLASLVACTPVATPRADAEAMLVAARGEVAASRAQRRQAELEIREADDVVRSAWIRAIESADARLERAYQVGLTRRTEPPLEGEAGAQHVVVLSIPDEIADAIQARRNLLEHLPARPGEEETRERWAIEVAQDYFIYGHFAEAAPFDRMVWPARCGKDRSAYVAWKRLLIMANLMGDVEQSRALAWDRTGPCAFDEAQKRESCRTDCWQRVDRYAAARQAFEHARQAAGDERSALFRQAAGAYEEVFRADPAGDDAPEGAINAAYAHGQVGEVDAQVDLLRRFVAAYGDAALLAPLKKAEPQRYHDHVRFTGMGLGALAEALVKQGDAAGAASALLARASLDDENVDERRSAACAAVSVFASIPDARQSAAARGVARAVGATCPK